MSRARGDVRAISGVSTAWQRKLPVISLKLLLDEDFLLFSSSGRLLLTGLKQLPPRRKFKDIHQPPGRASRLERRNPNNRVVIVALVHESPHRQISIAVSCPCLAQFRYDRTARVYLSHGR